MATKCVLAARDPRREKAPPIPPLPNRLASQLLLLLLLLAAGGVLEPADAEPAASACCWMPAMSTPGTTPAAAARSGNGNAALSLRES
jgi:hypothetical protein